jgi:hypothetical protein
VIAPPTELTTVDPPPSSAPLEPAVIVPEFVRVNDASPVIALPADVIVPWLVTAQPGLATEATPVPAEVTVAPVTTVALVLPGASAQPADPRTTAPFAPVMIPLASQLACAALPRASKAIGSITARAAAGTTAAARPESAVLESNRARRAWALGFMQLTMVGSPTERISFAMRDRVHRSDRLRHDCNTSRHIQT